MLIQSEVDEDSPSVFSFHRRRMCSKAKRFETPTRALKLRKGETLALPADVPMRTVVTGSTIRRLLAISFTMRRCLLIHCAV